MGLAFRHYMHPNDCGCKVCTEIRLQNYILEKKELARKTPCSFCGKLKVSYNPYYDSYKCNACENVFDSFFDDTVRYRYKDINSKTSNMFKKLFFRK